MTAEKSAISPEHHELASTDEKSEVIKQHLDVESLPEVDPQYRLKEKKLVRKLDLTLMPMVWVLYMFNYLDRNNIAQARLDDLEEDLGLVGNQFNVAVSILNVGVHVGAASFQHDSYPCPAVALPSCMCCDLVLCLRINGRST